MIFEEDEIAGAQTRSITLPIIMNTLTHVLENTTRVVLFNFSVAFPQLTAARLSKLRFAFLDVLVVLSLVLNVRVHTLNEAALSAKHDALGAGHRIIRR